MHRCVLLLRHLPRLASVATPDRSPHRLTRAPYASYLALIYRSSHLSATMLLALRRARLKKLVGDLDHCASDREGFEFARDGSAVACQAPAQRTMAWRADLRRPVRQDMPGIYPADRFSMDPADEQADEPQ